MYDELTHVLNLGTETRKANHKAHVVLPAQLMCRQSLQLNAPPKDNTTVECYMRNCEPDRFSDEGWGSDYNVHDVNSASYRKWYIYR